MNAAIVRTLLVLAVGAFCLGMGAVGLFAPSRLRRMFAPGDVTAEERNEIRAVYGGFGVALAGGLGWAATNTSDVSDGFLRAMAVGFGGMAFGRLVSLVREPLESFFPAWTFLLVEILLAGALIVAASMR